MKCCHSNTCTFLQTDFCNKEKEILPTPPAPSSLAAAPFPPAHLAGLVFVTPPPLVVAAAAFATVPRAAVAAAAIIPNVTDGKSLCSCRC